MENDEALINSLRALIDGLRRNLARSPWAREQGVGGWLAHAKLEAHEALRAGVYGRGDECTKEIGDVLWCVLSALIVSEEEYQVSSTDIVIGALEKLKFRKPWVFNDGPVPRNADEDDLWTKANKAKEKELVQSAPPAPAVAENPNP